MPLLVCMSLFFTCLILIFLSFFCELLVHVCCGLGLWLLHGLKNRHELVLLDGDHRHSGLCPRTEYKGQPDLPEIRTGVSASIYHLHSLAFLCILNFPFLCFLGASLVSHSSLFWIWLAMSLRSALLEHDLSIQVPVTI